MGFTKLGCIIFCLCGLYMTPVAFADDDIPLFLEEEDEEEEIEAPKPVISSTKIPQVSNETPNIGRNAQPISTLTVTPPPAPPIKISLTTPKPKEETAKPVNTRLESISLQKNSTPQGTSSYGTGVGLASDVRGFDLDGFYLGMLPEEVMEVAQGRGYRFVSSRKAISKFRTGYYESLCKSYGFYLPAEVRTCIQKLSQKNNTTYVSEMTFSKPKKRESIRFVFSSPATNHRVWQIEYQNKGDNSLNFTAINAEKKRVRQETFFNAIYDKYGYPDDANRFIWGSEDDAYMKVSMYGSNYDALITLVDTELSDEDYFEAQDWREENTPFEHFGFED